MQARIRMRGVGLGLSLVLLVGGCAKAPVSPRVPAPDPCHAEPDAPEAPDSENYASPPPPPASEVPGTGGVPVGGPKRPATSSAAVESMRRGDSFDDALEDFRVADLALSGASGACESACRALRSMMRSSVRMCALASTADEQERCERSKARVRAAREHVRRACGSCPQGPPLDDCE